MMTAGYQRHLPPHSGGSGPSGATLAGLGDPADVRVIMFLCEAQSLRSAAAR